MSWLFRAARGDDAERLIEIRRAAGWGEDDVALWLDEAAAGRRALWVAERGDALAGMVGLKFRDFDPDVADGVTRVELAFLAVAPASRGMGLARRLTELAEEEGFRRGFPVVTLNVNVTNAVAIKLYESMGYRETRRGARPWGFAVYLAKERPRER